MTDENGNPMDAVSSLLEERRRFEGWIATLEGRKATTPPHVYARVHADYSRRLNEVLERLAGRTGDLESATRDLRLRIDRLQEEENARRDERAEAELRATVGEYTEERWAEVRATSDAEIARLSGEVSTLRAELGRLEELLRTATTPPRTGESAAVPDPDGEPRDEALAAEPAGASMPSAPDRAVPLDRSAEPSGRASEPSAASEPAGAAPEPRASEPRASEPRASEPRASEPRTSGPRSATPEPARPDPIVDTRAFDELAFLKSVVEPRESGRMRMSTPPVAPYAASAPAPSDSPMESERDRASASNAVDTGDRVDSGAPPARTTMPGRRPLTPAEAAGSVPPQHVGGAEEGRTPRESVPSFLRDVPNEQVKTLKCQECGTMNYPTEWYCERCGGELAAM